MQHWQNFDIELFDHDTVGDSETVRVRVARSPAGVQRDPVTVSIPKSLETWLKVLTKDALSLDETILMGQELSDILLPEPARGMLLESRSLLEQEHGLRIRIELRSLELADLPWEFTYLKPSDYDGTAAERGFLALDRSLSIVRYEPVAKPPGRVKPLGNQPLKISALLANPDIPGWSTLDLHSEQAALQSAVQDETGVQLQIAEQATRQSLNETLDGRPHVLHFAGHGQFKMRPASQFGEYVGRGELLLENQARRADPLPATELATKMRGSGVRLAVLNNCDSAKRDDFNAFTGVAPTLVREGVPAVVAMQYKIRDQHAISLARRLYQNLLQHQSIDSAVTAARLAMFQLEGHYTRDWGVPVLYLRSDEAVLFPDESATDVGGWRSLGWREVVNIGLATVLVAISALLYYLHIEPRVPMGGAVGGVIAAALLVGLAFFQFVAGEALKSALLNWFRRRSTSIVLTVGTLIAGAILLLLPKPIIIKVVPGNSLITEIRPPRIENVSQPYDLRITIGSQQFLVQNVSKAGISMAETNYLANSLHQRYAQSLQESLQSYLLGQNIPNNDHQKYLNHWQQTGTLQAFSALARASGMMLELSKNGRLVACQEFDLNTDQTVYFLEKKNECE